MKLSFTSIQETTVTSVCYDSLTKILYIRTRDGQMYAYYDVPDTTYVSFMSSYTKEEFFHTQIKSNFRERHIV